MDQKAFHLLNEKIDDIKESVNSVRKDLSVVKEDIRQYKGFVGGAAFVFSLVWAGVTYVFSQITGRGDV